jgi:hypothetical protein
MPQTIASVDVLQQYIQGVMARAKHHANNVDEVALAIAGAVVWRKEREIEVMTREGDVRNVLWVRINGNRYPQWDTAPQIKELTAIWQKYAGIFGVRFVTSDGGKDDFEQNA